MRPFALLLVALAATRVALAYPPETVDFESVPGGSAAIGLIVSSQYDIRNGMRFRMSDHSSLRLGDYDGAWQGWVNDAGEPDVLADGYFRGDFFAVYPEATTPERFLIVEYTIPARSVGLDILDVDDGGEGPPEQWTLRAYDGNGILLGTWLVTVSDAGTGDTLPTTVALTFGETDVIARLEIAYTGESLSPGFGFDNFTLEPAICCAVDFESVPGGSPAVNLPISLEYEGRCSVGLSVADEVDLLLGDYGGTQEGWIDDSYNGDALLPRYDRGKWFATYAAIPDRRLVVHYATPARVAGLDILDVDDGPGDNPGYEEEWVLEAYDPAGTILGTQTVRAGGEGTGDAIPTTVRLSYGTEAAIGRLEIRQVNDLLASGAGVGFDDFLAPEPPCNSTRLGVDRDALRWRHTCAATALGTDAVRGDLEVLRETGGDFERATVECLGSNMAGMELPYAAVPAEGSGWWYLVRKRTAAGPDSYDTCTASQVGSRDPRILASGQDCP